VASALVPEVLRLARRAEEVLDARPRRPSAADSVERALVALLVGWTATAPMSSRARASTPTPARRRRRGRPGASTSPPRTTATLDVVRDWSSAGSAPRCGPRPGLALDDLVVRFQQTCGPVMAKGIEDTAFYRWHRLVGLNEVGGDPTTSPCRPTSSLCRRAAAEEWPLTMTTLSTHDTKRSEDVRARLAVLSERPGAWHDWFARRRRPLALPVRPPRRRHRVPALADPRRRLAARRGAAPGVRDQGRAGGEAAHRLVRPGPGVRGGVAGFVSGVLPTTPARARGELGRRDRRRHRRPPSARSCSSWSCRASRTSTRAPRPSTSPSSTPTTATGRLRRPRDGWPASTRGAARPTSTTRSSSSPPGAAAAPRPPRVVHRRRVDRQPGACRRRARVRRRAGRLERCPRRRRGDRLGRLAGRLGARRSRCPAGVHGPIG
jgi:hypothetical protein